jgi:phosphoglycolate phosphatase
MIPLFSAIGFTPKLVLFDLDGTLLDSLPDLHLASLKMAKAVGIAEPELSQIEAWVGNGAAVLVQRILAGQFIAEDDDPRFEMALQAFLDAYQELDNHQSNLYPGVALLVSRLHKAGIKQGVITNKPSRFVAPLLSKFGLLDYFDLVYSGDTFAEKKPHPMPLIEAAKAMDFNISQCLMVGDSSNDINAAKACGMPSLGVRGGYNHGEDIALCEPTWVVDSL